MTLVGKGGVFLTNAKVGDCCFSRGLRQARTEAKKHGQKCEEKCWRHFFESVRVNYLRRRNTFDDRDSCRGFNVYGLLSVFPHH